MDHQKWCLRLGAAVICCALVLRLSAGGAFQSLANFLAQPNIASFLLYLETGRIVRFSSSGTETALFAGESAQPDFTQEPDAIPAFTAEDAALVAFKNNSTKGYDPVSLMTRPLEWDLTGPEPTVLILHTHATESYTRSPGEAYVESSAFRTLDDSYNMVSVGEHLARLLEQAGIRVIHDRALHDQPSYNGSYTASRKSVASYLAEYPSIRLVLDLHRDAGADNSNQMDTAATYAGRNCAQLMLVVGTNGSGLNHPEWEENLALAMKLQLRLEQLAPGICRPINVRSQRFNQDQSSGALLVEVGAAGDSHEEALTAVEALAEAVTALARGAVSQ